MNDKSKLVKSHASLSKDCELLSVSLKTKEGELTVLTKSFETLNLTYLETLAKAYSSPIINVDACTTKVSKPSPLRNSKPSSPRKRKNMKSLSGKSNMRKHEMMNYA